MGTLVSEAQGPTFCIPLITSGSSGSRPSSPRASPGQTRRRHRGHSRHPERSRYRQGARASCEHCVATAVSPPTQSTRHTALASCMHTARLVDGCASESYGLHIVWGCAGRRPRRSPFGLGFGQSFVVWWSRPPHCGREGTRKRSVLAAPHPNFSRRGGVECLP